ncbi:MAG: UbiA family prenyltransferase [Verrucomicrobiota bacterium]|nr:UbiA family prenyltransferase [Verrucomicrobiota bacterium]
MARHWYRLLRLPNLLSAPGDPIAGFLLAGATAGAPGLSDATPCILAGLFFYAAGLVSNDCFDLTEDRRQRPNRPLPSGVIRMPAAVAAAVALFAAALAAAWFGGALCAGVGVCLLVAVLGYNALLKKVPMAGPLAMGLCRGLNILLGAACVARDLPFRDALAWLFSAPLALVAAAGSTAYIAAVTAIAAKETERRTVGFRRFLPPLTLLLCLAALCRGRCGMETAAAASAAALFLVLGVLLLAVTGATAMRLGGAPEPVVVSRSIGRFIRALALFQAALCARAGPAGIIPAVCLLGAWLLFGSLSRTFYSS